jgi:copper chaperone CopZ
MRAALLVPVLLLAPFALALTGCGDCDCTQHQKEAKEAAAAKAAQAAAAEKAAIEAARKGAPVEEEPTPPVVTQAWRGEGTTLELSVWHMHCQGCEKRVEDAIKALPGVKDVSANGTDSKVTVTLEDAAGRETVKPKIVAALAERDFKVLGT